MQNEGAWAAVVTERLGKTSMPWYNKNPYKVAVTEIAWKRNRNSPSWQARRYVVSAVGGGVAGAAAGGGGRW